MESKRVPSSARGNRVLMLTGLVATSLLAHLGACSDDPPSANLTPGPTPAEAGAEAGNPASDVDSFPFERGEKIAAAPGEWTWVPFPESSCANGKPTGIGVNRGTTKRLVIFMEGGGACWNALTCYTLGTASNLSGFGKSDFEARTASVQGSLFDRTDASNTFKDASFVYVPYCTGDVHAGNRDADYDGKPTKHVGRKNFEAFLTRIVPTFDDSERVVLSGSSAGGFGAAINFWRVHYAFGGKTRVDLVDDSGPPFPASKMKFYADWNAAWDIDGALPPGCPACKTEIASALGYYFAKYPSSRFALLSYDQDNVISQFYALTGPDFAKEISALVDTTFVSSSNGRAFVLPGASHTMLGTLSVSSAPPGPIDAGSDDAGVDGSAADGGNPGPPEEPNTLAAWLAKMQGDVAWQIVCSTSEPSTRS
jgi:hypothetical protein